MSGKSSGLLIYTLLKRIARNIKAHDLAVLSSFPSALLYNPKDIDNANFDVDVVYGKILVRVEHLQNMFFIERLLLRYSYPDEGDLLVVSYDMVTTTLGIWIHKDKFAGIRRDFEWLVSLSSSHSKALLTVTRSWRMLHQAAGSSAWNFSNRHFPGRI